MPLNLAERPGDFSWPTHYAGDLAWLPDRTLFLTVHGSRAYGTALPTSDLDIRGIAIAPIRCYLGVHNSFDMARQNKPVDMAIFDIRKFVRLAADSNPASLETLFTDPTDHLVVHPLMARLFDSREMFLSQQAKHTFCAYARGQLKRIRAHRGWLLNPPKEPPDRAAFGLPPSPVVPTSQIAEARGVIRAQLDQWSWRGMEHLDSTTRQLVQDEFERRLSEITGWAEAEVDDKVWLAAAKASGFRDSFIEVLDMERRFTSAQSDWVNYQTWLKFRNPARAELEAKFGYDTKNAMHLVRLMQMVSELLTKGVLQVRRPNADELVAIRNGLWTYDQLVEFADRQDAELNELLKTSPLPREPNREALDGLCQELIMAMA